MTHNGNCQHQKGKLHSVGWDYKNPEFSDDNVSITFSGNCRNCGIEFQKTYSNPLLTIISTEIGEMIDFDHLVDHLN